MRILAVSDIESKYYYDFYSPGKLDGIDLIISCGDLDCEYLEFLVTMAGCPLLYVHGNHDDRNRRDPEGCICIDDLVYDFKGIRIMGLGGSFRYRDGKYMYTESQMKRRLRRLWYPIKKRNGIDILVTHAPARHLNDLDTLPHRGFECFNTILEKYQPKLFLHGHVHRNYGIFPQRTTHNGITVINAFEHCVIDYVN